MTSPVDTSVKFFFSRMANAPVLNGVAGSLVALLDAFLVTGFNTVNLTSLVVSGGVATATFAGTHASEESAVVLIAGVSGGPSGSAGLNGEQKITSVPSPTTRTFATALPDGTYTGTITMKMASLGWTKVYTGANVAVYKSSDVTSSGNLLRVDDTGATVARVVGYESMSDINTGVGPFPTVAQISGGGYWTKSTVASAAATQWAIIGDSKDFKFINAAAFPANANYIGSITRGFGDPITQKPGGDPYSCVLNCSLVASTVSQTDGGYDRRWDGSFNQCFSPRTHTGLGSGVAQYARSLTGSSTTSSGQDSTLGVFPNECVDGAIRMSRRAITQVGFLGIRALVPGVFHIPQDRLGAVFTNFDKFTATDGRRYAVMQTSGASLDTATTTAFGVIAMDLTGPWR
jgi:hypothetical protein